MRGLLVALLVLVPAIAQAQILGDIKYNKVIEVEEDNIIVYIQYKAKITHIKKIYTKSKKLFFKHFEPELNCDINSKLKIYVVSKNILTNPDYFSAAKPTNFGRYFRDTNELYIIDDFKNNHHYLAHELAHYFYDECGIRFDSDEQEHDKVYEFQRLYYATQLSL